MHSVDPGDQGQAKSPEVKTKPSKRGRDKDNKMEEAVQAKAKLCKAASDTLTNASVESEPILAGTTG